MDILRGSYSSKNYKMGATDIPPIVRRTYGNCEPVKATQKTQRVIALLFYLQTQLIIAVMILTFWIDRSSGNQCLSSGYRSEPLYEKTSNLGFQPGPTQTSLYSHRSKLEA